MTQVDSTLPIPLDEDPSWIAVPLWAKNGTVLKWSCVDVLDLSTVQEHRWVPVASRYAGRYEKVGDRWTAIYLHRELLGLPRVKVDDREGDHKNRDRLDNRRENLREATRQLNMQNVGSGGGASSYRGVARSGARWRAYIFVDNHQLHLGCFALEEEAAEAASEARKWFFPGALE